MPSVNEQILDRQVSHQIGLLRYSNSVTQKIVKHLNRVEADLIRQIIDRASRGTMTAFRQAKILDDIAAIMGDASPELWNIVKTEMAALGVYETEFQTRILTSTLPAELVTAGVSMEQVRAATMSRPFQGRILREWVQGLDEGTRSRLRQAVRIGFTEGETTDQIVRRIRGTRARQYQDGVMEISRRGAEALARTAVNHTATVAREELYQANADIIKGVEWVSTLDASTTLLCASRDGRIYEIGKGPRPPAHINCLPGDANVSSCSRIARVYKRAYKGALVQLRTKSGRVLRITPNHPVLTRRGWVAAQFVNASDQLACITDSVMVSENQKDYVKSKISDLFSAANVSADSALIADRPTAAEDFHGDVADSEVSVVDVDLLGWRNLVAKFGAQNLENLRLKSGAGVHMSLACLSARDFLSVTYLSTANSIMRGLRKLSALLWSAASHACGLLLGSVAKGSVFFAQSLGNHGCGAIKAQMARDSINSDSRFIRRADGVEFIRGKIDFSGEVLQDAITFQDSADCISANADQLADLCGAESIDGMEFDDVVEFGFCRDDFCDHVYNLENAGNWYTCDSIIVHNCRSSTTPVTKSFKELGLNIKDYPASTRASMDGQVAAGVNYGQWLKRQPVAVQNEVLGVQKAKLFRKGDLSIDKFVDSRGNAYTLDELRRRESAAFEKAGLSE